MSVHNAPAFPFAATDPSNVHLQASGMTLRDWFAGQALAGYFACPHTPHMNAADHSTAEYAYRMADAMIAAREVPDGHA